MFCSVIALAPPADLPQYNLTCLCCSIMKNPIVWVAPCNASFSFLRSCCKLFVLPLSYYLVCKKSDETKLGGFDWVESWLRPLIQTQHKLHIEAASIRNEINSGADYFWCLLQLIANKGKAFVVTWLFSAMSRTIQFSPCRKLWDEILRELCLLSIGYFPLPSPPLSNHV